MNDLFYHTLVCDVFHFCIKFSPLNASIVYHMDKSTLLPPELTAKGVGVGVAVLLSSADDNVLVI